MNFREYLKNLFSAPSRPYRFIPRLRAKPQERKTLMDILFGTKKDDKKKWKK